MMANELSTASGVNLGAGNEVSATAARIQKTTHTNSPWLEVHDHSQGHFRGLRTFSLPALPEGCELQLTADGNGTKTQFNVLANRPEAAGFDLLAMLAGDVTRKGGLPLALINQLDVSTLKSKKARLYYDRLLLGLNSALGQIQVVGLGGETAEMNEFVGTEGSDGPINFNWCGTLLSAFHPDRMILGNLKPGQSIVGFREPRGYRCNGGSTVRLGFRVKFAYRPWWERDRVTGRLRWSRDPEKGRFNWRHPFGRKWWENPLARPWIEEAAQPSTLYDLLLTRASGWDPQYERIPLAGIAHITGGGIIEKLGELLRPLGLSADLFRLFPPTSLMQAVADWLREAGIPVTDEELYGIFNGGQAVLVILDDEHVEALVSMAKQFGIEAQVVGRVIPTTGEPCLMIDSMYRGGQRIRLPL